MDYISINGVDYSQYVQESTYAMDRISDTYDWEDGNGQKHKIPISGKIIGSFEVVFTTAAEFNNFYNAIKNALDDKSMPITVVPTNRPEPISIDAYLSFETIARRRISTERVYYRFAVGVEEK